MATAVRRIKRADAGDGNSAGNVTGINHFTSDAVDGLSDAVDGLSDVDCVDPVEFVVSPNAGTDTDAPYGRKADGTPRQRRGRKSGPARDGERKTASGKKKSALGVEGLASIMANLTLMIAAAAKVPEVALSNDETTLISDAVENVAQYYDFSLNSKAVAWTNLAVTVGGIVGAHVVAYKMRRDHEERLAA